MPVTTLRDFEPLIPTGPTGDERPLVLIVDDGKVAQRRLQAAFSDTCETAAAHDGLTGLQLAEQLRPDLIVTDLALPELDGRAMVRAIRARNALADVPILVVTGAHDAELAVELLRDGAQDVMRKPFLVPEVQARGHNLLEAKRARDELGGLLNQHETDLGRLAAEATRHQRRLEAALDEVQVARELAESASRVKSNFLRMMSHELKTPVTALVLRQQVLGSDPVIADGPEHVRSGFESISRSIFRLLHIVDTVLEWARVESGRCRVSVARFDLREAVAAAADEIRPRADTRGVEIVIRAASELPPLASDARIVRLIVINLLERAVSLTEKGDVQVELTYSRADERHRLRVTDGGPPLTRADQTELFDALASTADLVRRGGHGSGLGLHVVRDLARALGGDLGVDANNPTGNQIVLTLTNHEPGSD